MMAQPDAAWEASDRQAIIVVSLTVGLAIPGLLIMAVVLATPEIVPPLEPPAANASALIATPPHESVRSTFRALVILLVFSAARARWSKPRPPTAPDR